MKKIKKIFILFTMLVAGLSFNSANNVEKNVVADAADAVTDADKPAEESYAYINRNWQMRIESIQGVSHSLIKNLLITNIKSDVKSGYLSGCPVDAGIDSIINKVEYKPTNYTDGCAVAAYIYPNATDETMFDCILYANVQTIYATSGDSLFSHLANIEKITFNCKISLAQATDASAFNMFYKCVKLVQIEGLDKLNTYGVTNMSRMVYECNSLETIDVSHFDTSKVTTIANMFRNCTALSSIEGLEKWNTSNMTDMSYAFYVCSNLTLLDVSNFDTSKVTTMDSMFGFCKKLTAIKGLETFNTSNVTSMSYMFSTCSCLTSLDVSSFDTSNVTNFSSMFSGCESLTTIKGLETFKTSNATNMGFMFNSCKKLEELNVSNFDTSNVSAMSYMFLNCSSIKKLDLSNFDLRLIKESSELGNYLGGLTSLEEIKAPKNLNGLKISLPNYFGMGQIDSSMEGWTIQKGSKEFNTLYNTLLKLKTCDDYMQSAELQALYDKLRKSEQEKLGTLTDSDGVILTEKLAYMVYLADYYSNTPSATESHLSISPVAGQYLVIVIACFSLAMLGGYYFIQKKKYAK